MAQVDEAVGQASPLNADLKAGLENISQNQTVTFTKYVRLVLPLDGYVFWVKADLLSQSALFNAGAFNTAEFNEGQSIVTPAATETVKGSLHYASDTRQDEAEEYTINRVVFTAEQPIKAFNEIGQNVLFIGTFQGIKFAFSRRESFYQQAGLHHYVGDAVYSTLDSQLVDSIDGFDTRNVIVSNSLPIWLSMNGYVQQPWDAFGNPVTLYPSFLVPLNLPPPYGAVHIQPDSTRALAAAPTFSPTFSHTQLVTEKVRVTLYGLRNFNALDFVDFVSQFSVNTDLLGVMNQPVVHDEKKTQTELLAIAMKKTVEFEINYLQHRVNDVARQLILQAIPTFYFTDVPITVAA
jgi:hypothetical protein